MNAEMIKLLQKLVSFRSIKGQTKEINACLRLLCSAFGKDFFVRRMKFAGQPVLLLSNTRGTIFDFVLAGHIDVVAASDAGFVPRTEGDRLYGRGTRDMKGPLVAGIFAMRDWLAAAERNKKVAIIVSTDEETGGASMQAFLNSSRYRSKCALIPDGGDERKIIIGQKGFIQLKVAVMGKSAHAATPSNGENPIEKVFELMARLRGIFPQPHTPDDWRTSITLTQLHSGVSINQVPEIAEACLDIRYTKKEHRTRIIREVKKYIGKSGTYDIVAENQVFELDPDNTYINKLCMAVKKITGKKALLAREAGTSDAIFFVEHNIPVVLFWPQGGGVHQEREWVSKKSLQRFYKITYAFLESL